MPMISDASVRVALQTPAGRLFCLAAALYMVAAWFSIGHYHADEYWQVMQLAAYAGGHIAEYHSVDHLNGDSIRSAFMPVIGGALMQALSFVGIESPALHAFALRVLSALLALAGVAAFYHAYAPDIKSAAVRRCILAAMLFLYPLVFFSVRFSGEGWMASFLLLALAAHRLSQDDKSAGGRWRFAAGLYGGFMFFVRYQSGLVIATWFLYVAFIRRESPRHLAVYVAGFAAAFIIGAAADFWLYGKAAFPWLEYARFHIAENIPGQPRPWHAYLTRYGLLLPPVSLFLPLLVAAFYWQFPRHSLTWATALFLILHLIIANKQTRFLYPLLPLLPFMCALLWEKYMDDSKLQRARRWAVRGLWASAIVNVPLLLFVMFFPAAKEAALMQNCIGPQIAGKSAAIYVMDKTPRAAAFELDLEVYGATNADFYPLQGGEALPKLPKEYDMVLFASRRAKFAPPDDVDARLVCRALPEWVLAFNFNDWTSRASVWRVFRLTERGDS